MARCRNCGKEFEVLYPELWRYRDGNKWFCSWGCLRAEERKEAEDMTRMKKDGTPAKKPGRKPAEVKTVEKLPEVKVSGDLRIASEEPAKVELLYDESIAEEYRREQAEKAAAERAKPMTVEDYEVTAIQKEGVGQFYYDKKYRTIDWRNDDGEEASLHPAEWVRLAEEIPKMLKILGAERWT